MDEPRSAPRFVGIDIGKDYLDVHIRPTGSAFRVSRDEAGLASLVDRLRGVAPALIVLEPTGGSKTGSPTGPVLFVGDCYRM